MRILLAFLIFGLLVGAAGKQVLIKYRQATLLREVPFQAPNSRADLRSYAAMLSNKAFAASVTLNSWGWSSGNNDSEAAERTAIEWCEEYGGPCLLYAVGNTVVWDPARAEALLAAIVSSREGHGAVWRYHGEESPHGVPIVMPPEAPSIISDYLSARGVLGGLRSLNEEVRPRHQGIDIIGPTGAPVVAAADGTVLAAFFDEIAGNWVEIAHSGPGGGMRLIADYIHLDRILVKAGDEVHRGQQIGTIGTTGRGTTPERPHLHFEIRGTSPHLYWHDGPGRVTCFSPDRTYDQDRGAFTYPVPCDGTFDVARPLPSPTG